MVLFFKENTQGLSLSTRLIFFPILSLYGCDSSINSTSSWSAAHQPSTSLQSSHSFFLSAIHLFLTSYFRFYFPPFFCSLYGTVIHSWNEPWGEQEQLFSRESGNSFLSSYSPAAHGPLLESSKGFFNQRNSSIQKRPSGCVKLQSTLWTVNTSPNFPLAFPSPSATYQQAWSSFHCIT